MCPGDPLQSAPPAPFAEPTRLLRARDMQALAAALGAELRTRGLTAQFVWSLAADEAPRAAGTEAVHLDVSAIAALAPGETAHLPCGRHVLKLAGRGASAWAALLIASGETRSPGRAWAIAIEPWIANVLELDRLRQSVTRLEQAERLQRALFEITDMASSELDMPAMLEGLHRIVGRLMHAENFFIALYDAPTDSIRFVYFADTAEEEWQEPEAVEPMSLLEGSLTWHVIRHATPLMGASETLYEQVAGPVTVIGPGARDWLGVPILIGGQVRAALVVQSYVQGNLYTSVERDLLSYVGTHIVTAIDRKRAFERLEQQTQALEQQVAVRRQAEARLQHEVLHDPLTGLPNRAYLREHLARAIATRKRDPSHGYAVLFLDLDRFKVINDSAGHSIGDALLQVVARRLAACLRPQDIVARLGGDEFAVVMHEVEDSDAPVRLAQRLIEAMREPVRVQAKELFTGVSVGIALGSAAYSQPEELLRDADIAMYRVKEKGRGGFELFDEALHHQALERLALESDLRLGIARGEFEPYYQSLVRLEDGAVLGYEALVRWNHPSRGLLAPGAFLRIAEASGQLEALDWQLYASACRHAPALLQPGQYVHLNVSPRHFRGDDLDVRLLDLLQRCGVRPDQVRIEITEDALIDSPERVAACLKRLQAAGICAALDDFGTGYSSMSYLQRFCFHTLKLDRSFITELAPDASTAATAVVRAVVDLARALGLNVIAEGIETEDQRRALVALGCAQGQGYLFSRAAPFEEVLAGLRDSAGTPPR